MLFINNLFIDSAKQIPSSSEALDLLPRSESEQHILGPHCPCEPALTTAGTATITFVHKELHKVLANKQNAKTWMESQGFYFDETLDCYRHKTEVSVDRGVAEYFWQILNKSTERGSA